MAAKNYENADLKGQRRMIDFLNIAKRLEAMTETKLRIGQAQEILEKRDRFGPFGIRDLAQLVDVIGEDVLRAWGDLFGHMCAQTTLHACWELRQVKHS